MTDAEAAAIQEQVQLRLPDGLLVRIGTTVDAKMAVLFNRRGFPIKYFHVAAGAPIDAIVARICLEAS